MKKRIRIAILLNLLVSSLLGQVGNEWIDFDKTYVKVSVAQDGFYKITPSDISDLGVDLSIIDPKTLKLYRRGKECAINVIGYQDDTFDTLDYIEFYGTKNDGEDDTELYVNRLRPNPFNSLYTDTSGYFLTWGGENGKRFLNDTSDDQDKEASFVYENIHRDFRGSYSSGEEEASYIWLSEGSKNGGFVGAQSRPGDILSYNLVIDQNEINTGGGLLEFKFLGDYDNDRTVEVKLTSGNQVITKTSETFSDYETVTINLDVPAGFITDEVKLEFSSTSLDGEFDIIRRCYYTLFYDVKRDFSGLTEDVAIEITDQSNANLLIPNKGKAYDVSDFLNVNQIVGIDEALLNNDTDVQKKYFIRKDTTEYLDLAKIGLSDFQRVDASVDYIIITNKTLLDGVEELKQFKETDLGGERTVGVYEVDKLYDTYSYGDETPLAIRRLLTDYVNVTTPKGLFLVGTSVTNGHSQDGLGFYRYSDSRSEYNIKDLVPTMGQPASDILFSVGLGNSNYEPFIPTGRLPVQTNQGVVNYVRKLRDHALVSPDETWTKNLLHLSGGTSTEEGTFFLNRITDYKELAEDELLGANVQLFSKRTNLAIEEYNLSEQVNNGLSMITYLGHSSPNTIEIDIGEASDPTNGYNNKGRYPVLFLNGCNSASYDEFTRLENWVTAEDRGAIVGFGHTGFGYTSTLNRYTTTFYNVAFQDSVFYGQSLGEIQKETIRRYALSSPNNPLNYTQMTQWTLLGDPDVKFAIPLQPDFTILNDNITVLPGLGDDQITAATDSIKLVFELVNFGKVSGDSLDICINRNYNSGKDILSYETIRVATPNYKDTVEITLFNALENAGGENLFVINIDCGEEYSEFNELNNEIEFTLDLSSNGVNLLYPYPFAIVGEEALDFWVESQDKEQDTVNYIMQLSYFIDFSEIIYEGKVQSSSLVGFENVDLNPNRDTTVYYWRARIENNQVEGDTVWKTSSFTYIDNKTGWGQFEYDQYKQNVLTDIVVDEGNKELIFDSVSTFLEYSTVGQEYEDNFIYNTNIIVNDRVLLESLLHANCNVGEYLALAFDGTTLLSYEVDAGRSYNTCGPDPKSVANFRAHLDDNRLDMRAYLDSIPVGDYLLLMSTHNNRISATPEYIISRLREFGSYALDSLEDGLPYVFLGRKGDSTALLEVVDTNKAAKIEGSFNLKELTNKGSMSALEIGPIKNLLEMSWSFDLESSDEIQASFYNTDSTIVTDTIAYKNELFFENGKSILKDTAYNLGVNIEDVPNRTLAQLNHWSLCYDIAPEGVVVLDLTGESSEQSRELFQGDTLSIDLGFINISPVPFSESLDVFWSYRNIETGTIITGLETREPLNSQDTLFFNLILLEPSFYGKTELTVTFNPRTQLEQNYFNNSFVKIFNIEGDNATPVVEAFFDDKIPYGIMESTSSPKIDFYINDNNERTFKTDTNNIEMYISGPCEESFDCDFVPLYFQEDVVSYDFTNESFHVQINLEKLEPGYYEIQFFGSDALGNNNTDPYVVRFFVSAESALSYFLPYPSPFSSEMRFVYQKKGSELPEDISIQIISATGSLVRLVTQEELGELKSGDNLTDWSWDGTDDKGNLLPNGVYFYKLMIESDTIKHLETSADKSFNKEWGSIMIAR